MVYDATPWLKSYDADVQAEIAIPEISLERYLVRTFSDFPDRPACHYLGMSMSFGQLLEQSGRFARALHESGIRKGDVVAINLPNMPQYLIAVVGSLRAGCAVSGVAPLLMPDEIVHQLRDCGAKALITLDTLCEARFAGVADQVPAVKLVLVTGAADYLAKEPQRAVHGSLAGKSVLPFVQFVERCKPEPVEAHAAPDDICFVQYTGGTTGTAKGAMLTNRNLMANLAMLEEWMKFGRGTDTWLTGFPMFHMAGLFISTSAMVLGITQILIPDPRNIDDIIAQYKRHRPTFLANVPSLYLMLLGSEAFRGLDFSHLRYCLAGAAPFPVEGIEALESVVGAGKVVEVWGMTETSPLITMNPGRGKKRAGSVGLPLPSTRLRVVDLVSGCVAVPLGEEGELICSGPQVMKGYLQKPEETQNALREHDGAIWMHTGDVGRMDEDGYVYVVDRCKDMIIVGGFKVFSSEVEDKLYKHPAVGMCAVVGSPNPERPDSEIVKLVIQKSEAYKNAPDTQVEAEVLAFARERLAPYKVPKLFEFVGSIPLTSVGKVDKKMLRRRSV